MTNDSGLQIFFEYSILCIFSYEYSTTAILEIDINYDTLKRPCNHVVTHNEICKGVSE